jgi:hypothetical protein
VSRVAGEMDALRIALGEVDVLATLTAGTFDAEDWIDPDPETIEGVASLLGLIKKSAAAAKAAFHRLHGAVADEAPAPAGEAWDYSDGTALGNESETDRDAEIVQRIRTRCPDGRYDGNSNEELIELFKRNRRVLARSDEDVIAAMVSHAVAHEKLSDHGGSR